ncbi:ABC transporter ATP-binding protein [Haloactinomyces albus]|uniref:Oligopeptide transport system ATP-binding protein n=1 Tax=Haloactinomyces albus TaxID=1352928 RepID=A0AAE3ZGA8_9ACTN|nr:ABC transporter ATP-binding protein [Haloactinomyces albus]MDR7302692.1 oligopeptide transport system ATP-binding protein [Haloactinomyces albus]
MSTVDDKVGGSPESRLLEVEDLHVEFRAKDGVANVINGVSYHVDAGETLAVLGESGSGKSVTAQTVMGILDTPPGFVTGGSIRYRGEDMLTASDERRRGLRGENMAMIFQDALSALNPVFTVGFQIAEQFRFRRGMSRKDAMAKAAEMLDMVQIPNAKQRVKEFPHQFSGGMRQRAMIAMSLALDPDLLIADEPTTALDVTVQAQIMDLLDELRKERGMGLILITHDLGVVAEIADRIAVMYAGRIVESADAHSLYEQPGHPYTEGLMESIPRLDMKGHELASIQGLPPNLTNIPPGCPFHPRCYRAEDQCREKVPEFHDLGMGRTSACHFAEELMSRD